MVAGRINSGERGAGGTNQGKDANEPDYGCGAAAGAPVLPVLVIEDTGLALDLAGALAAGGIEVLEVTLRTPRALDAVAAIRKEFPDLLVGAGTLIHTEQFLEARDAGAHFAVSPGCTERLAAAAEDSGLPYLPGVMTPSEVLLALEYGYRSLKLFPANGNASVKMLKSFRAPSPASASAPPAV